MITVYTKQNCQQCVMAKNLLTSRGYKFDTIEIDYGNKIDGEKISREDFMTQYPGVRELPLIVSNGEKIGGYKQLLTFLQDN